MLLPERDKIAAVRFCPQGEGRTLCTAIRQFFFPVAELEAIKKLRIGGVFAEEIIFLP